MRLDGKNGALFVAATMQAGQHNHGAVRRDALSGSAAAARRLALAARCTARKPRAAVCRPLRASGRPSCPRRVLRAPVAAQGACRAPDDPRLAGAR